MFLQLLRKICIEVLARLPIKDLRWFKFVCRKWNALISSPTFIKKHHNHVPKKLISFQENGFYLHDLEERTSRKLEWPFESGPVYMLHCHGMLCVALEDDDKFFVWNPAWMKFRIVRALEPCENPNIIGFGYDRFSDDYKIVTFIDREGSSVAHIFEFKTNSWKESVRMPSPDWFYKDLVATVVDHRMYWIAYRINHENSLLCFDFVAEEYEEWVLPFYSNTEFSSWLGVVQEKPCVIYYFPTVSEEEILVWVPEKPGMDFIGYRLNKILSIKMPETLSGLWSGRVDIKFTCFTRNNELLLLLTTGRRSRIEDKMLLYDARQKKFEEIRMSDPLDGVQCVSEYVESLVPVA